MRTCAAFLVSISLACGKGQAAPAATDMNGGQTATLRLLGVRATGPVLVHIAAVELVVDGVPMSGTLSTTEMDLGNDQNAWAVMTFKLPATARQVSVKLSFRGDGTVERDGKTQALDLRGPPLSLIADAAQVRTRSKVVIEMDVPRSLVDQGDQVFLLPEFIVRY